jgi:hypothetical protein
VRFGDGEVIGRIHIYVFKLAKPAVVRPQRTLVALDPACVQAQRRSNAQQRRELALRLFPRLGEKAKTIVAQRRHR